MSICPAKEKYPVFMMGFIPSSLRNTWLKIKTCIKDTPTLYLQHYLFCRHKKQRQQNGRTIKVVGAEDKLLPQT